MSSSRSIAAARQKRAGEQSNNNNNNNNSNTGRPGTSISSQAVFAQQQQQTLGNVRYNNNIQQQPTIGVQKQRVGNRQNIDQVQQPTKISLPNAIALTTLRLGRLEQFIQEAMADGTFGFNNNNHLDSQTNGLNDNMKMVSDEVFENIVNRLDRIENSNNDILNRFNEHLSIFDKEIKDMKDSVNNLNNKFSSFINETSEKFFDFEAALVEIENSINCGEEIVDNLEDNDVDIACNLENNTIVDNVENIEENN
jgi:hypothetical protein